MTVMEMQQAILDKGWQFKEHVFNDGNPHNCAIWLSQSKDPLVFLNGGLGEKGWGRFQREHAWRMAYDCIVLGLKSE